MRTNGDTIMTTRKGIILGAALAAFATIGVAQEVKPVAVSTFFDLPEFGGFFGTTWATDPNGGPPNMDCIQVDAAATPCAALPPGNTTGRVAYLGNFEFNAHRGADGFGNISDGLDNAGDADSIDELNFDDAVVFALFDGVAVNDLVGHGGKLALRFNNAQHFGFNPYNVAVSVIPSGPNPLLAPAFSMPRLLFHTTSPRVTVNLGFLGGGSEAAKYAQGNVAEVGRGVLKWGLQTTHAFGVPPSTNSYTSFDASLTIPLEPGINDNSESVLKNMLRDTLAYTDPLVGPFAWDCDSNGDLLIERYGQTFVEHPLVLAITGAAGSPGDGERVQDGAVGDEFVHIHGDCDFAGEPAGARHSSTYIALTVQ